MIKQGVFQSGGIRGGGNPLGIGAAFNAALSAVNPQARVGHLVSIERASQVRKKLVSFAELGASAVLEIAGLTIKGKIFDARRYVLEFELAGQGSSISISIAGPLEAEGQRFWTTLINSLNLEQIVDPPGEQC